jgi:hypothetical protein
MSKIHPRLIGAGVAGTGLVAGIALGVTGVASASTSTTTSPSKFGAASVAGQPHHDKHRTGADHRGAGDLVTAVSGNTLTLDTPAGVKTVTVTPETVYQRGMGAASLANVKPNEIVRVRFVDPTAPALVAKSVRIELARADGYVTAVNGTSFTIVGRDGFALTVQESSTTVYRNASAAGSPTEVSVGKLVHAEGNVDANGTTLDATRIGTGNPPKMTPDAGTDPGNGTGTPTG